MKTLNFSRQKKHQSAFTLIEIMVATVVMVILTGLVIQITSEVLKVWNRSSGKLTANAEARIVMDLLTQDLEAAVFRNNNMTWLESEQVPLDDPFGSGSTFKTTELKLFSPAQDRPTGPGDICGISYLLKYSDPITGEESGTERTFILYRNVIDPRTTFEDLMGENNQESLDNPQWSDDSTIDEGRNYLASNIVDFRVDFYVEDDGITNTDTLVSSYGTDSDPMKTIYGGDNATVGPQSSGDNALKNAVKCTKLNPNWAKGWTRLASSLNLLEKKEKALVAYKKAKELDPDNEFNIKMINELEEDTEEDSEDESNNNMHILPENKVPNFPNMPNMTNMPNIPNMPNMPNMSNMPNMANMANMQNPDMFNMFNNMMKNPKFFQKMSDVNFQKKVMESNKDPMKAMSDPDMMEMMKMMMSEMSKNKK